MTTPHESRAGGPVNGVASGSLIAARYRLSERLRSDLAHVAAWAAHDQILGREVRLTVLGGEHVAEALDSARRAALVADTRLTRVLDVGSDTGISYVVTDLYRGRTLSDVVAGGMLSAGQARAIVGEVAAALEVAARRGVHHLALRPDAVRLHDGRVLVTGLGLDAGLAGADQLDAERTSHADAVGLVALLYYAMTARWPGPPLEAKWIAEQTIHPLPALRQGAAVAPLSDIRRDCPADLAALCHEVFSAGPPTSWEIEARDVGPQDAGAVVTRLQPWGAVSVGVAPSTPSAPAGAGAGVGRQSIKAAFETVAPPPPGTPPPAPPVRGPGTGRIQRGAASARSVAEAAPAQPPPRTDDPSLYTPAFAPTGEPLAVSYPPRRRRGFRPTLLVLVLVLAGVGFGAYWAFTHAFFGFQPPLVASTPTAPATAATGTADVDLPPPPEDVRPEIASGLSLDPEGAAMGDRVGEHPELVQDAFDGAPDTYWFTRRYKSAAFGGLKSGVGFAITLVEPAKVTSIVLSTNNTGGNVEVRAASLEAPTEGPILASGPLAPETELVFAEPVESAIFVLWFTELPPNPSGEGYRIELKEILVS